MQRLLRRQPPVVAGGASSSGRLSPSCVRCPLSHRTTFLAGAGTSSRQTLPPCRITSTSKELYQSKEAKEMNMDDNGEETYMDLPDVQVFDPDKGPLEKRVQRSFLDACNDDKIDLRDTEYWFSNPTGNWNSKPKRVYFMPEEEEPMFPQPWHHPDEANAGDERIAFSELDEGRVYLGMVTDVWLYHGVQVDIGAEFDGLVPCNEDLWELAVDHIDVGEVVMVEIHKMRTPGLYRWPLQVKFTVKGMQDLMMPPDDYEAPVDHGWAEENGWTPEDIAAAAGRTLDTPTYFVPMDQQLMAEEVTDGYGTGDMYWRDEPSEPIEDYIDDPMEDPVQAGWLRERSGEVDAAVDSLLGR